MKPGRIYNPAERTICRRYLLKMPENINSGDEFPDFTSLRKRVHGLSQEEGWEANLRARGGSYVSFDCKTDQDCPWRIRCHKDHSSGALHGNVWTVTEVENEHNHAMRRRKALRRQTLSVATSHSMSDQGGRRKRKLTEMEQNSPEREQQYQPACTQVHNTSTLDADMAQSMASDGQLPQTSRRSTSFLQSHSQPSPPEQQLTSASQAFTDAKGAVDPAHRQYDQANDRDGNSKVEPRTDNVSLSPHPSHDKNLSRNSMRTFYDVESSAKILEGDDNKLQSTPKYLHHCPGHPRYCSYRNQKPAVKTKHAIIYDLPAYFARRDINHRRNLRNLSLNYGPELGPPFTAQENDVHVLGPDETSISISEVRKGARVVSWLVQNIPTLCPEWHIRSEGVKSFKLSGTMLVWDMNQKWAVDVPHHQAMGALRQLRAGLKDDIDLMEDSESLESVDIPRTAVHESIDVEEEDAARLVASFTAPMNRRPQRRLLQSNRNSSSLWHVEDRHWGGDDDNYDDGEEGYLDGVAPAYDEDGELSVSSQIGEDYASDDGMQVDSSSDINQAGYNMTIVNDTSCPSASGSHGNEDAETSQHHKKRSFNAKEAYFISLLRGYLNLGLTNTTINPGPSAEIIQHAPQQEQILLLERGIKDLEGGHGVDENLLKFVVERCAAY